MAKVMYTHSNIKQFGESAVTVCVNDKINDTTGVGRVNRGFAIGLLRVFNCKVL